MSGRALGLVAVAFVILLMLLGSVAATMTPPKCNVEQDGLNPSEFTVRDVSTSNVWWADTRIIMVVNGGLPIEWHPVRDAPDGAIHGPRIYITWFDGMYCNLTDITGDGLVNEGDFFVVDYVLFAPAENETPSSITLSYYPLGESMWTGQFVNGFIPYEAWPPHTEFPWYMIGGIVAAVVAVAGTAMLLIARRQNR